ncbi:hypothetical protein BDZ91DRAFT_727203 [Kalaharituber pfeilii]|nr:hypothetical protein BDZ91DRAFT_727203 [Kalaharituber pfeilii]
MHLCCNRLDSIYFHSIHNCSSFRLAGSSLRSKQASISFPAQTAHFTYHYITKRCYRSAYTYSQEPNSTVLL